MITGSTHTLGVIVADIENPFFARAVRGISDRAHEAGFEVILANSDENVDKERAAVAVLLEKKVDGLIVAPASPGETGHLAEVIDAGVPIVLFDRSARIRADAVVVDNEQASYDSVTHLIGFGHRRIAVLSHRRSALSADDLSVPRPGPAGAMTNTIRLVGWAGALRAAGLPVTEDLIRRTGYDRGSAAEQTLAALTMDAPATAIFSTDNTMTLGAVEAIISSGRSMPRDVSLVAFDDLEWTILVQPPLTVIRQPVYELGATATRRLLGRLAGEDGPPETIVLHTEFVVRASTGPVAVGAGA
jgi:LacI family transcriptional regulator